MDPYRVDFYDASSVKTITPNGVLSTRCLSSSARRNDFLWQNPNSRFMKHELPTAIALLAMGCMLWFWQSNSQNTAEAARQSEAGNQNSSPASEEARSVSQIPNLATNESENEVLLRIAKDFEDGVSRLGDLEIESRLNNVALKFKGRFWELGSGSGKSRLELVTERSPGKVTAVCTGRYLYRLTERPEGLKLTSLDLERLNTEDTRIILATLPASWIGSGSIGTLLRNLGEAFELKLVQPVGESSASILLEGTWNLHHLSKLMLNHVDHREIVSYPSWSKIPDHFPHGVRIQIARLNDSLQQTAIQFFRFAKGRSENGTTQNLLTVKFGIIQKRSCPESLFQMDSYNVSATDETQTYLDRVQELAGNNRIATEASSTIR